MRALHRTDYANGTDVPRNLGSSPIDKMRARARYARACERDIRCRGYTASRTRSLRILSGIFRNDRASRKPEGLLFENSTTAICKFRGSFSESRKLTLTLHR